MGSDIRNNLSSRIGESKKKRKIDWKANFKLLIFFVIALLFFLFSFQNSLPAGYYLLLLIITFILGLFLVYFSFQDKWERSIERRKKKKLIELLKRQRIILKESFDLQNKLKIKQNITDEDDIKYQKSLNFVSYLDEVNIRPEEEDKTNQKIVLNPEKDTVRELKPQKDKLEIEGEDVSDFPPEWQEFLKKDEGKDPIEKLNDIFKNN